jgi:formylglycine-generating enzyme required for sulfatase activity/predicted Ser/Thr protein kinase
MKLCPTCSHENSDGAIICSNCQSGLDTSFRNQKTILDEGRPASFEPDSLISDRYRIIRELGRGGMGVVYLVEDTRLRGRLTALKMIHPELVSHEEARQRFKDEVILCLDLFDPHIVRINNLEESDRLLYFTMEYIQGHSLRQMMDARKEKRPPFSLEETVQVIGQILDALSYAHQTTIHRDIKPENILIQEEVSGFQVKVLDFGIAKILSASRFTRTAQSMGTAYYMSPEQIQGAKHIDQRSDLYAVGMILYEMLTGEIAVGWFDMPGELVSGLPGCIDRVVKKVLSKKPEKRHDSAGQLKSELADCLAHKNRQQTEEQEAAKRAGQQKVRAAEPAEPEPGELWTEPVTGMDFVYVPGGSFMMGSDSPEAYEDEQPVHEVRLDGFWIGKYPVTQGQWQQIMGNNPSEFELGDDFPVERVFWDDAKKFITLLNQQSGRQFVLPTEAQWEYAARSGGRDETYSGGNDVDAVAWYDENSEDETHRVGTKAPNGLGIYDMSGNVYEWCEDMYDENAYSKHARYNPVITSGGTARVFRGGDWDDEDWDVRAAYRGWNTPAAGDNGLGFRLSLPPVRQ